MDFEKILSILNNDKESNAQKAIEIFAESLQSKQKLIFRALQMSSKPITCKEISALTGINTKNLSTQLRQLNDKCQLIKTLKISERKYKYYLQQN